MSVVDLAAPIVLEAGWDGLVAELHYGVVLHDERGAVVTANAKAAELLDLPGLVSGADWSVCDDSGSPLPTMPELARQIARAGAPTTLALVVTKNGQPYRRLWADIHPVAYRGRSMVLIVIRPVDTAAVQPLLDPTTRLPHRALLFDRIAQSLVRSRIHETSTTLVLADVCGLGDLNRESGFDRGDELLAALADRLRRELPNDQTVARYSGGTFAVVCELSDGAGFADHVRSIGSTPVQLSGRTFEPRLRVGWATGGGDATVHSLVSQAESRLR